MFLFTSSNKKEEEGSFKFVILPEKFVTIGGRHFCETYQNPVVMTVTLLRDVLQNLPKLHTHTHKTHSPQVKLLHKFSPETIQTSYHVLFHVFILCHLDERLEQPAMMLDENLTGFPVPTLKVTRLAGKLQRTKCLR